MLGSLSLAILNSRIALPPFHAPLAQVYVEPVMVIVLCVLAGLGTVLLLPSRLESAFRGMGVDEVACLVDFGLDKTRVLDSLRLLSRLIEPQRT